MAGSNRITRSVAIGRVRVRVHRLDADGLVRNLSNAQHLPNAGEPSAGSDVGGDGGMRLLR